MNVDIITVGRLRSHDPLHALYQEYARRMTWTVNICELDDDPRKILRLLKDSGYVIVLDEGGTLLSSRDFAQTLQKKVMEGSKTVQFLIGGPDGHTQDVRARADMTLAFGLQTWPHRLVRMMLLEQLYRAQQILTGHPYHRD